MTDAIKWIYLSEYIIGDIWETLADLVNWMLRRVIKTKKNTDALRKAKNKT
jgi:hypothetical protein